MSFLYISSAETSLACQRAYPIVVFTNTFREVIRYYWTGMRLQMHSRCFLENQMLMTYIDAFCNGLCMSTLAAVVEELCG